MFDKMKIIVACTSSLLALIGLTLFVVPSDSSHPSEDSYIPVIKGKAQIIVIVPATENESYCSSSQFPVWERGEEIMLGATIAENEINSYSELKIVPKLEIVPIRVPRCSVSAKIHHFVGNLTAKSTSNLIAVVGYFCDNLTHFFSRIVGRDHFGLIQISATAPPLPRTRGGLITVPRFHHMLPSSSVIARAAAALVQALNWSQIGIINQGFYHGKYFTRMKEQFVSNAQKYKITTVLHIEWNVLNTAQEILKELRKSIAKIMVVFLPPFKAKELICEAHLQGLSWPDYAWVYVETHGADIVGGTGRCSSEQMKFAIEKVIFVNFTMWQVGREHESPISGRNYSYFYDKYTLKLKDPPRNNCLQSNPYANVMYDSIWAIAIATNRSHQLGDNKLIIDAIDKQLSELTFPGATGFVNFSRPVAALNPPVGLYQGLDAQIGSYDTTYSTLIVNYSKLGKIPDDELDHVYQLYPVYLTAILLTLLILLLIFTTVTMSLYIHYRKNPEIKASSSLLSLCMFVGCYCLIISSLIHTVLAGIVYHNRALGYADCWGNTFLFTIGLDIILATVCAKTIRIYRIFTSMSRLGRAWSDKSLFAFILLVVFIKVLLMIIWASVDMNHLIDEKTLSLSSVPPHYIVVQKCYSRHLGLWVGLAFGYSVMLFLPMVIAAVLTRRIDKDPFKDSKKICALVAVLFVLVCVGSALWFLLRNIGADVASKAVYSLGFTLAALVCQCFLFLPKVIPCVRRHMDILKTTWVDTSMNYSEYVQPRTDHNYHLL